MFINGNATLEFVDFEFFIYKVKFVFPDLDNI
jgi:hypothetical protein